MKIKYSSLIVLAFVALIGGIFTVKNTQKPSLFLTEANFGGITVSARGTNGEEKIALYVNGAPLQFWNLDTNFQEFTYIPDTEIVIDSLAIHFLNDRWEPQNGINYDVQVQHVTVNGTQYSSEHASTVSTGSWDQDNWCAPGSKQTQWLHCSGSFAYNIPVGTVVGSQEEVHALPGIGGFTAGQEIVGDAIEFAYSTQGDPELVRIYAGKSTRINAETGTTTSTTEYFDTGKQPIADLLVRSPITIEGLPQDGSIVYVTVATEKNGASLQTMHSFVSAQSGDLGIAVVENGFHGGGFVSNIAITSDGEMILAGGDVSGIHRSDNAGVLFSLKNKGVGSYKIASVAITPDNENIVYAGTGDKGNSGGLLFSEDGGDHWGDALAGDRALFAGNHPEKNDPVPDSHPRPNGNLLAIDTGSNAGARSDDVIIAGTYKDGVVFLSSGGDQYESTALSGGFIKGVSIHPSQPNIVYAAAYFRNTSDNGIYKIDYSQLTSPSATLVYATAEPEEVVLLENGNVYAAVGKDGIAGSVDNGATWSSLNTDLVFNENYVWQGITGYASGGRDILYIGVNNSQTGNNNYSNIWRSKDGGVSWTSLVDNNNNVIFDIYDGDTSDGGGDLWFFRSAFGNAILGKSNTVVSSIAVANGDNNNVADDEIYVSGRGGIWKSDNGGDEWYPVVRNYQASSNRDATVNPNNPKQVVLGNTDYTVIEGTNRLVSGDVNRDRPEGSESVGYDVEFDGVADQVIVASGERDHNTDGKVFVQNASDLGGGKEWTDLNIDSVTPAPHGRVRAVTHGYHDGTSRTDQVILAAVEGEGVYRYDGDSWKRSTGISIAGTKRSNFVWPDRENSGVVFLVDLNAGIYRSLDGGRSWRNIWVGMPLKNNDFYKTGYITADENDPSVIYVSIQGDNSSFIGTNFKVYRLENANDPSVTYGNPNNDPHVTDISKHSDGSTITRNGPIKLDSEGRLWLTRQQDSKGGHDAGLFLMENPSVDTVFTDVTTQQYAESVVEPTGMDVSSDGYIYIAQQGMGVVRIRIQE